MRYYKVRTLENITLERLRGTGRDYPAARECAADCRVCQMHWVCRVRQLPQHLCVRCAINCKAAASQITRLATQLTHPLSLILPPPPQASYPLPRSGYVRRLSTCRSRNKGHRKLIKKMEVGRQQRTRRAEKEAKPVELIAPPPATPSPSPAAAAAAWRSSLEKQPVDVAATLALLISDCSKS